MFLSPPVVPSGPSTSVGYNLFSRLFCPSCPSVPFPHAYTILSSVSANA